MCSCYVAVLIILTFSDVFERFRRLIVFERFATFLNAFERFRTYGRAVEGDRVEGGRKVKVGVARVRGEVARAARKRDEVGGEERRVGLVLRECRDARLVGVPADVPVS